MTQSLDSKTEILARLCETEGLRGFLMLVCLGISRYSWRSPGSFNQEIQTITEVIDALIDGLKETEKNK